ARHQRQFGLAEARLEQPLPAALRRAAPVAAGGGRHLHRLEFTAAQLGAHLAFGVGLDHALDQLAVGVQRAVVVGAHALRRGDPQHLLQRGFAGQDATPAVVVDTGPAGAGVGDHLLLAGALVDHGAHPLVDGDEFVDAGAAAVAGVV